MDKERLSPGTPPGVSSWDGLCLLPRKFCNFALKMVEFWRVLRGFINMHLYCMLKVKVKAE